MTSTSGNATGTSGWAPSVGAMASAGYALVAYLAFVAVAVYSVGFVGGFAVPHTVDAGAPSAGTASAVAVDAALVGVFALQHSLMARPAVKRRLGVLLPRHLVRSTFVLGAAASLALAYWQWRPVPAVVWQVDAPAGRAVLWALFVLGWALVVAMTFAIDHFEMFGLRQVAENLRGQRPTRPSFRLPLAYRLVRHPMMLGFFIAFLAIPTMTAGHLLFAALGCGYILVGVRLEERDLAAALPEYAGYAAATPRFVPRPASRGTGVLTRRR